MKYHMRQKEITWPSYDPNKLAAQLTPTRRTNSCCSISWVSVLVVYGFPLLFNNKKALEPHCNTVQRHVATTSLLRDNLPSPKLVYFPFLYVSIFRFFDINEMKFYLCCIYMFMCIFFFCRIPHKSRSMVLDRFSLSLFFFACPQRG